MRNPVRWAWQAAGAGVASVSTRLQQWFDKADVLMAAGTGAIGYGVWRRFGEAEAAIVVGAILLFVGLKAVWR